MPSVDPIVITYGIAAAEYLVLAIVLVAAAVRNHFAHRQFRPAILSLATLSFILSVQNGLRIYSAYLRTTGKMVAYFDFLGSGWWLFTNILATLAGAALFFTLIIAYPASRYSSKHKRDPDEKVGGSD